MGKSMGSGGLIGFDLALEPSHACLLNQFGVPHTSHSLKSLLPQGNKEPEPKLLLELPRHFHDIRDLLHRQTANSFLIPGQIYTHKTPLVSILLDTCDGGYPMGMLEHFGRSLRFRFEIDPGTVAYLHNPDFNEKTSMETSEIIAGCADRDERERALEPGESNQSGYEAFLEHYRKLRSPAFCNDVPFSSLKVAGGYIAARTELGFAVKDPDHPVIIVFEACEDRFVTLLSDMIQEQADLCEFEFEAKQIWGELPPALMRNPVAFRQYLYNAMSQIALYIHENIQGSIPNHLSKAEIARQHARAHFGLDTPACATDSFNMASTCLLGDTLDETLTHSIEIIRQRAAKLHHEKLKANSTPFHYERCDLKRGNGSIRFGDPSMANDFPSRRLDHA